jgi:hypothetical protein
MRYPAGFLSAFFDPLKNPNAPTSPAATGGDSSASVSFTAPTNTGSSSISSYTTISTPGSFTGSAASSPITVSGLTNGTSYTFNVWATNSYGPSVFSSATNSVTPAQLLALIVLNSSANNIGSLGLSTLGNTIAFGNLSYATASCSGMASSTRAIFSGNTSVTTSSYCTFATAGNSVSFGSMYVATLYSASGNNSTRGIVATGWDSAYNNISDIQYCTIATTGSWASFGNLAISCRGLSGCSSPVFTLVSGGYGPPANSAIYYFGTSSSGSSSYWGSLTTNDFYNAAACSNNTRGLWASGSASTGSGQTTMCYVTMATTGNATTFGSLSQGRNGPTGFSSQTYGFISGGNYPNPAGGSTYYGIDYVTLASTGNSSSWGTLSSAGEQHMGAASQANGGL